MPGLVSLRKSKCLGLLGVAKADRNLEKMEVFIGEGVGHGVRVLSYTWRHHIGQGLWREYSQDIK